MLINWNFRDGVSNSTLPQVNRQKSARNLFVREIDRVNRRAVFFDAKRNEVHAATLQECDCTDFLRQKKSVKPCMHIYRLAAELDLFELTYLDNATASRVEGELGRMETGRLQLLPKDTVQWGGWSSSLHDSFVQRNRQWRGYDDVFRFQLVERIDDGWRVNGWPVSLSQCTCPDFAERKLPCKHIYSVAIAGGIALPLALSDYRETVERGEVLFFYMKGKTSVKREDAGLEERGSLK